MSTIERALNIWASTLQADISAVQATCSVDSVPPNLPSVGQIRVSMAPSTPGLGNEIAIVQLPVTGAGPYTVTFLQRGVEGTTASIHGNGDFVVWSPTAQTWKNTTGGVRLVNTPTDTILESDARSAVVYQSACTVTLPQAQPADAAFGDHFYVNVIVLPSAGSCTFTPTSCLIDGAASLTLTTSQGVTILSNGINYYTVRGLSSGAAAPTQVSATFDFGTWQSFLAQYLDLSGVPLGSDAAMSLDSNLITLSLQVLLQGVFGTTSSVFGASGPSHSTGLVPDPGSVAGTTRFLREDATFAVPTGITQLTGNVTAGPGSGSQVATIANQAVTYAKMQNISATSLLLGRGSAGGAGSPQEITVGTGLSIVGTTLSASSSYGTIQDEGGSLAQRTTVNFIGAAITAVDNGGASRTDVYVANYGVSQGRLTLTTATPITTADVTAATTVFFTPYLGNRVNLYDGTRWNEITFTEQSILTTATQTGTMVSGQFTITGLTDTSQLVRGMKVTGTSVGVAAVINSIDSATQVTVSVANSGSTTNAVTFKCPASTNYDIFSVLVGGALKIRFGNAWTSGTARADALGTQDGVDVNNAAINAADSNTIPAKQGVYEGTIGTTTTDGQTEDSITNRFVINRYNAVQRILRATPGYVDDNANTTWTTASTTYVEANGGTGSRFNFIIPLPGWWAYLSVYGLAQDSVASTSCRAGAALDSTVEAVAVAQMISTSTALAMSGSAARGVYPSIGRHFAAMVVCVGAASTGTFFADLARQGAAADPRATYMEGWILG